jgi:hypothetical protein
MEELMVGLLKGLGISHVTAALIIICTVVILKGFKLLVRSQEKTAQSMADMTTEVKLTNQWCQLHDKEDERRFDELHHRIGNRRDDRQRDDI